MRLTEISKEEAKATFVRKLKDPAVQEMHDLLEYMEVAFADQWRFTLSIADRPDAAVLYCQNKFYLELGENDQRMIKMHTQMIKGAKYALSTTEHWVWDTWQADAAGTKCYFIRK